MLLTLALAAAIQAAPPPHVRPIAPAVAGRSCARDGLEHAGGKGVVYREGDRPAEQRRLDDLPDADMVLTVLKRDESGCAIVDIVRRGVSTASGEAGAPQTRRAPRLPQAGRQGDR